MVRTGDATIDYGTLLGEGAQLAVDSATRIDATARTVRLASGRDLDYDYVIYAVGSTAATPSSVPGAAEYALSIAEFESAQRLRARLDGLPLDAAITVVGGGLTGIETAAELAEQGRTVTLVCGRTLAPYLSTAGRRYVARWLTRHGVAVLEAGVVSEVRPGAVVLAGGAVRASALTIWTAGFGVPRLAAASGLRTDATEQFLTAAATGDLEGLLSLLAPDVTWTADSDGKSIAVRRPVVGARKVAAVLMTLFRLERLADLRIGTPHDRRCAAGPGRAADRPRDVARPAGSRRGRDPRPVAPAPTNRSGRLERDALPGGVKGLHAHRQGAAHRRAPLGHEQAGDVALHGQQGAERRELRDAAVDDVADTVPGDEVVPVRNAGHAQSPPLHADPAEGVACGRGGPRARGGLKPWPGAASTHGFAPTRQSWRNRTTGAWRPGKAFRTLRRTPMRPAATRHVVQAASARRAPWPAGSGGRALPSRGWEGRRMPAAPDRISVEFLGDSAGEGPLSWGQLENFSAIVKQRTWLPLGGVKPLEPGTTLDEVAGELRYLMSRYEPMRTLLRFAADGTPTQVVYRGGEIDLEIVDAGAADPGRVAEELCDAWRGKQLDFATEWPLRMAVVRSHGALTHMAVLVSHFVTDAAGALTMLAEVAERTAAPVAGLQPLAQAHWQTSPAGQRHNAAAQRYWEGILRTVDPDRFPRPAAVESPRYWHGEYTSPALGIAARSWAASTGLDSSTVLLAAFAGALTRVSGIDPVVIRPMVSNRFRPGLAGVVCTLAQAGLLSIPAAGADFAELLGRARRVTTAAYKYAYFHHGGMERLVARVAAERGVALELGCYFNDRRGPSRDEPIEPGESSLRWVAAQDAPSFEPLFVHVDDVPGTLRLSVYVDAAHLSPAAAEEVMRGMERLATS
ncbi:FAD-dependent oxidoreductase [Dactylosporangium sp. CA-233914]|uniref:FAD-dependent oxidoreductase n=1 Tax=Dactylosporangium sp. CA-233914 TaxID=3239934 RepID=UPI003D8D4F8D